jgi:transposase-like protein/transposase Tn5 family protein
MPAAAWAMTEIGAAALGDPRRTRRVASVLSDLAERPGEGIPAACATPAATKAAYRLLTNEAIVADALLGAHIAATTERLRGETIILAVQDTTALDFTAHPALAGAGPLAHPAQHGLWVHSVLAATVDGVPLGLLHQQRWARDPVTVGKRATRRQRPTAEKESQRWLDAQAATDAAVPAAAAVVTVADREADIYDLFALPRPAGHELLIRATHNRRIGEDSGYLWAAVAAAPVGDVVPVAVGRRADRPPREALLTLRWVPVTLVPPRNRPQRAALPSVPVVAILAEEPQPPPGEPPIRWLLLTTQPVATGEAALECVRAYAQRWLVERYHYALKSGCRIEALQLRTTERLERALALYAIVAWRLLWLTYLARAEPEQPCSVALATAEWQVLYRTRYPTADLPTRPPPLGQAVRWIARLGGFQDRHGDGDPGVKVLWRGLRRLEDLTVGWQLAHTPPSLLPPAGLVGNG